MSRKRQNVDRRRQPAAPPTFALTGQDPGVRNAPRPNRWFLATAVLLQVGWLAILLFLAVVG